MPMKTFTFNGSRPLIDRQMPVKTLPYDGKCVWGGVCPRGESGATIQICQILPKTA